MMVLKYEFQIDHAKELFEKQQYAKVFSEISILAKNGNSDAQNLLGQYYHFGLGGLPVDFKEAKVWYEKSTKQGHPEAPNHLGRIYLNGEGVKKDKKKAKDFYYLAAKRGDVMALHNYCQVISLPEVADLVLQYLKI